MIEKYNKLADAYINRPLSNRGKAWPLVILGLVFVVFSWYLYINPQTPPFTGKWRWLSDLMYTHFGLHAVSAGIAVFGVLVIAWGIYHTGIFTHRDTPTR